MNCEHERRLLKIVENQEKKKDNKIVKDKGILDLLDIEVLKT